MALQESDLNELLPEIERYLGEQSFALEEFCFDKQLEFINCTDRFKTACCGGRAGKTVGDAAYLIDEAQKYLNQYAVFLYITLSRSNAKRLIWPELLNINQKFNLGGKVNESDLSIQYGRSFIYASGAQTRPDIEKFRGLPIRLCIIDEGQSFPPFIEQLINEVIATRLFDFNGTLALTGTPGPVPVGYFHEACHKPGFTHFHWTMFDNPWIEKKSGKTPDVLLQEELERRGVDLNDAAIQREIFGRWVSDTRRLVIEYDSSRNHYDALPTGKLYHVIGIDLGYQDADAIVVIGYGDNSPTTYLVDELVTSKQGLTELIKQVETLREKYAAHRLVIDTGGLGLKIAEEMRRRYRIPVVAAEKARKFENIELFNDSLRTGRFLARKDSRFANDSMLLEWDMDKLRPDRKVISDRFHSDIIDAALYAFRESPAYAYAPPKPKIKVGSVEWYRQQEEEMEENALKQMEEQNNPFGGGMWQ